MRSSRTNSRKDSNLRPKTDLKKKKVKKENATLIMQVCLILKDEHNDKILSTYWRCVNSILLQFSLLPLLYYIPILSYIYDTANPFNIHKHMLFQNDGLFSRTKGDTIEFEAVVWVRVRGGGGRNGHILWGIVGHLSLIYRGEPQRYTWEVSAQNSSFDVHFRLYELFVDGIHNGTLS